MIIVHIYSKSCKPNILSVMSMGSHVIAQMLPMQLTQVVIHGHDIVLYMCLF